VRYAHISLSLYKIWEIIRLLGISRILIKNAVFEFGREIGMGYKP
jgi:hypothetical protein